jgi:mannose-6-phosphate isomerase-like protein (cupin superfamily)
MPINVYESFSNPLTGETFKCLSSDADCYKMQWIVQPSGYVALEHIHYYQDEVFHIKKGQARIVIDGKEMIANAGDTLTVPKGKRHIAYNNKPEMLECEVDYVPGLDYETFFQFFIGLQMDKEYDKTGKVNIPKMCYFTYQTKLKSLARPTSIPAPIFQFTIHLFGVIGSVLGWKKQLQKYVK